MLYVGIPEGCGCQVCCTWEYQRGVVTGYAVHVNTRGVWLPGMLYVGIPEGCGYRVCTWEYQRGVVTGYAVRGNTRGVWLTDASCIPTLHLKH